MGVKYYTSTMKKNAKEKTALLLLNIQYEKP
jgi:hypothetical protein